MNAPDERRVFVRHTASVPLEIERHGRREALAEEGLDVSHGGLSFLSTWCPEVGEVITLRISTVKPPFEANARVAWCRESAEGYLVGVQFMEVSDAFRARMVEQVCAIEEYRSRILADEGRMLSTSEAAAEWIAKYADRFPGRE